ncbi:MAG: acetylornithine deacetylase [Bacteroidetes bacterium]|nr:MAG: acetylornithine deacetylase [Bacteroidota bacterium]
MFANYFKTAWRNLWKNKGYSLLNIFGLAIGIAIAGLIFLWAENESTWDMFNVKKDRLYFVDENQKYDTYTATFGSTPGLLGPAMQAEIPGIANTCRTSEGDMNYLFRIDDKSMYASGKFVEPSLFTMFTLPFVQGNPATAFKQLRSMVITEKAARKFFGEEKNVIGKTVTVNNKQDYTITGVIKDIPENSSLQFEWVAPFEIYFQESDWLHKWGNNSLSTYVELQPGTSAASVNQKLFDFIQKKEPSSIAHAFLFSMNDWHLRNQFENGKQTRGGQIEYVHLFSIIAWIILVIACINFMNLSTARSEKRAREVGVRKVLGSKRQNLIFQFIGEAFFMALISAIVAILIIQFTLPAFNLLVEKNLALQLGNPVHISALVTIVLLCGLIAGSYPSLYLSSFDPASVLKGLKLTTGSAPVIRKGLVVLQFAVSITLIISTIIIYQQIQHIKSRNLGFNKNKLLQTDVVGDMAKNYPVIRQELIKTGMFENIALSDHVTLYSGNNTGGLTWDGKSTAAQILISQRYITPDFFSTSGIKILEGRDLKESDTAFVNKTIYTVITKSLENLMGKGSAIGKTIHFEGDTSGMRAEIVGVVNDYLYGNLYSQPDPVMFYSSKPQYTKVMYLRLKQQANEEKALGAMQGIFKKYNPAYPFNYLFVDDQFNNMFLGEMLISKLSRVFAALAILISCMGLFGLSAYTAERRTKEIGVRKVLGASIASITALLSKDFIRLVAISCVLAFPITWWAMHNWLQNYQYRIEISWWVFLAAGIIAILIALMTISFQSMKAAMANPVKSLRTE